MRQLSETTDTVLTDTVLTDVLPTDSVATAELLARRAAGRAGLPRGAGPSCVARSCREGVEGLDGVLARCYEAEDVVEELVTPPRPLRTGSGVPPVLMFRVVGLRLARLDTPAPAEWQTR